MEPHPASRTGLVVIRAWVEEDVTGFRARIIERLDVTTDEEVVATVQSADELITAIEGWLRRFLERRTDTSPSSGP